MTVCACRNREQINFGKFACSAVGSSSDIIRFGCFWGKHHGEDWHHFRNAFIQLFMHVIEMAYTGECVNSVNGYNVVRHAPSALV